LLSAATQNEASGLTALRPRLETACRNTHQHRLKLMPILPQVQRRVMPAKAYCFVGCKLTGVLGYADDVGQAGLK